MFLTKNNGTYRANFPRRGNWAFYQDHEMLFANIDSAINALFAYSTADERFIKAEIRAFALYYGYFSYGASAIVFQPSESKAAIDYLNGKKGHQHGSVSLFPVSANNTLTFETAEYDV